MSEIDNALNGIKETIVTMKSEAMLREAAMGTIDMLVKANDTINKMESAMSMGQELIAGMAKLITEMQQKLTLLGDSSYEDSKELQEMLSNVAKLSELV